MPVTLLPDGQWQANCLRRAYHRPRQLGRSTTTTCSSAVSSSTAGVSQEPRIPALHAHSQPASPWPAASEPQPPRHAQHDWPGLAPWRAAAPDPRRGWGDKGPCASTLAPGAVDHAMQPPLAPSLVECAVQVLNTPSPTLKAALTHRTWTRYRQGALPLHSPRPDPSPLPPDRPARPALPRLVSAKLVPSYERGQSPLPLAAHMLHNLAHIELNAVDLAWDTVARFAPLRLPAGFYEDFARVADDESRHLGWCLQRLQELGHSYGDMDAHDLLWEGAQMSAGDVGARLAVIPLSQEARGLDAGARLAQRLIGAGDARSAAIVAAIAREERAHVAIGVAWFRRLCAALELHDEAAFRGWLTELCPDLLKGPFNHEERNAVGLPRTWYDPATWSEEERERVKPSKRQTVAAAAAAAADAGLAGPSGQGMEQGGRGRSSGTEPLARSLSQQQLHALRERLALMVQREAEGCDQSSGVSDVDVETGQAQEPTGLQPQTTACL